MTFLHPLMIWLFTPIMEFPNFPLFDAVMMPANMIWMYGLAIIHLYEHWMKYYYYGGILK